MNVPSTPGSATISGLGFVCRLSPLDSIDHNLPSAILAGYICREALQAKYIGVKGRTGNMKILESQSAALTNYEVLMHLDAVKVKPRTTTQKSQNVETVLKEVQCSFRAADILGHSLTLNGSSTTTSHLQPPLKNRLPFRPILLRSITLRLPSES